MEKFTDRARKVLQLANEQAQALKHEYIGTEHILLALVLEGSGVAANVLLILGIDLKSIQIELTKLLTPGPVATLSGRRPQTPRAKKVIEYAIEEARLLDHQYVGTEHLLLGLIREEEGVASLVLQNLGVRLEQVREQVIKLLGYSTASRSNAASIQADELVRQCSVKAVSIAELPLGFENVPGAIVAEFDRQIDSVRHAKRNAINLDKFELFADLVQLELKLKRLREEFLNQWR